MKCVITGGGSGGHIFPGVALAQEFMSQNSSNKILFIGSEYGLETKLVPKAGFELKTLKVGQLVGKSFIKKCLTLFQIPLAIFKCIFILKKFKADFVIGVGGYAAGPCIIAAKILGLPIGVLEQNAVLGFTNKIAVKCANFVFTAFDEIPEGVDKNKCIYSGNPSRSEIKVSVKNTNAPFVLFIFGGSQGAKGINRMMLEAAKELLALKSEIKIIHQTGPKEFDQVKKAYDEIGYPAEVHAFIHDMQSMYNQASLIICRAGSGTIFELGASQNAAILIPFPQSAGNHQLHNAELLDKKGAGVLLRETTTAHVLSETILKLKNDSNKLAEMRTKIADFYKNDAASKILNTLITQVKNV